MSKSYLHKPCKEMKANANKPQQTHALPLISGVVEISRDNFPCLHRNIIIMLWVLFRITSRNNLNVWTSFTRLECQIQALRLIQASGIKPFSKFLPALPQMQQEAKLILQPQWTGAAQHTFLQRINKNYPLIIYITYNDPKFLDRQILCKQCKPRSDCSDQSLHCLPFHLHYFDTFTLW